MRTGPYFLALAVVFAAAPTLQAQAESRADSAATVSVRTDSSAAVVHAAIPSSMDAPAAVQRNVDATPSTGFAMASTNAGLGPAKAMMGVGIAGVIVGALIGGDSGKIIMVGSAVIGLYGLYQYLQ